MFVSNVKLAKQDRITLHGNRDQWERKQAGSTRLGSYFGVVNDSGRHAEEVRFMQDVFTSNLPGEYWEETVDSVEMLEFFTSYELSITGVDSNGYLVSSWPMERQIAYHEQMWGMGATLEQAALVLYGYGMGKADAEGWNPLEQATNEDYTPEDHYADSNYYFGN